MFPLFIIFSILPSVVCAKTISIATEDNYYPFVYVENREPGYSVEILLPGQQSSNLKGSSWELIRKTFHSLGYSIQLSILPWKRVKRSLDTGTVDLLFPFADTAKRRKKYFYSKNSVSANSVHIFTLKNKVPIIGSIDKLENMKIGVIRGYSYGTVWDSSIIPIKRANESFQQNFKMLLLGRLEGVIGHDTTVIPWLKKELLYDKLDIHPPIEIIKDYLVAPLGSTRGIKLVNEFDKAVAQQK